MKDEPIHILYLEDDEDHAILFMETLAESQLLPHTISHRQTLAEGIEILGRQHIDVVILDLGLPESQGLDTLKKLLPYCIHTPVVVVTTNDDLQLSIDAIKAGAQDFLVKGELSANAIVRSLRYAMERFEILDELEKKNESLTVYAVAASHDLQTPLRNILNGIDTFHRKHGEELAPEANDTLSHIVPAVRGLYHLIASLSEFAEEETRLSPSGRIDTRECAEEAVALLAERIEQTGATIRVEGDFPTAKVRRDKLVRVFQALLTNAMQYVADTPKIVIGATYRNDVALLYVRDNGLGISPAYRDRIFEPLRRLHTQHQYPGAGMGLSICKRIVEAHGGRIWVEAAPQGGSVFCFTLQALPPDGSSNG